MSTSLLYFCYNIGVKCLVCSILKKAKESSEKIPELPKGAGESTIANVDKLRFAKGDIPTAALRLKMQKTMQQHAAVFRRGDILKVNRW